MAKWQAMKRRRLCFISVCRLLVSIWKKWREIIHRSLIHITNMKYHIAYLFVSFLMTLENSEGHSQDLSNAIRRTFVRHSARFQLTRRVARSLCDSWASCFYNNKTTLKALRFTDKYELTDCGSFFEERDVLTGNIRLLCCGNVDNAISRAVREIRQQRGAAADDNSHSYGRFTTTTPLLGLHRSSDAEQTKTLLLLVYRVGQKSELSILSEYVGKTENRYEQLRKKWSIVWFSRERFFNPQVFLLRSHLLY